MIKCLFVKGKTRKKVKKFYGTKNVSERREKERREKGAKKICTLDNLLFFVSSF